MIFSNSLRENSCVKTFAIGKGEIARSADSFSDSSCLMAMSDFRSSCVDSALAEKSKLPFCEIAVMDESLQEIIDVVAAEVRVAVGGEHLINVAFAGGDQFEDGNVEGAAAEIVDGDVAALLFVQAISQRGGGGLVDQAQNFKAGDASGVFGGLALRVVEIGGHGNDRAIDGFAEVRFGPVLAVRAG